MQKIAKQKKFFWINCTNFLKNFEKIFCENFILKLLYVFGWKMEQKIKIKKLK